MELARGGYIEPKELPIITERECVLYWPRQAGKNYLMNMLNQINQGLDRSDEDGVE